MAVAMVITVVSAPAARMVSVEKLRLVLRDLAAVGRAEHLHAEAVGREALAAAGPAHPFEHGLGARDRFVETSAFIGPMVAHTMWPKGVMFSRPLSGNPKRSGSTLCTKGAVMSAVALTTWPARAMQPADLLVRRGAKALRHLLQRARRERRADHRAHLGVARRIVGEENFRAHGIRVVPGARGVGKGAPIHEALGDVLEAPDHGDVLAGEPHHRRHLAQAVVHRAGVAHGLGAEHVLVAHRNFRRHPQGLPPLACIL